MGIPSEEEAQELFTVAYIYKTSEKFSILLYTKP